MLVPTLGTQILVQFFGTQILVPNCGTSFWYQNLVPFFWYQILVPKFGTQIWFQIMVPTFGTQNLVPKVWYQIVVPKCWYKHIGTNNWYCIMYSKDILQFVQTRWRFLLITECLFLTAFFIFLVIRMANPDLWHPFRGGEKPMDIAYLNAIVKSTAMPPYDPWFSGGFLNYYYFGQFIVAMLIKATAIELRTAYNLAIPLFFAMTIAGSFSIGYNLAVWSQISRKNIKSLISTGPSFINPYLAGCMAAIFVAVLGNLDGIIQVVTSLINTAKGLSYTSFDFWQSSRMMPPDPPGFEITEFPFFSFLFADSSFLLYRY